MSGTSFNLSDVIMRGVLADMPSDNATDTKGRLYFATDIHTLHYDDGTTWQTCFPAPFSHTHSQAQIVNLVSDLGSRPTFQQAADIALSIITAFFAEPYSIAFSEGGDVLYFEDGSIATKKFV